MSDRRLILASTSPRRRTLLAQAGIAFEAVDPEVDDDRPIAPGTDARELVIERSRLKAQATALRFPDACVIGVDTVIADDEGLVGKPIDRSDAERILRRLMGREHRAVTGITIIEAGAVEGTSAESRVRIEPVDEVALNRYLDSDLWVGKAGAYGIQDGAAGLGIALIAGDIDTVIGLPMTLLKRMLDGGGKRR